MDDIIRTVKGDPGVVLETSKKLNLNLQFTIEELGSNYNLAFWIYMSTWTQEKRSHVGGI